MIPHLSKLVCVIKLCKGCNSVGSDLRNGEFPDESLVSLVRFQENVVHAVEKVCSVLPSTLSAQCKDLIEAYGQAIIELLVQEADPKTVCTVLGLCRDASHAFIRESRALHKTRPADTVFK